LSTDPVSLRRRFFKLASLNIISNITVPLAGLVDTAMLGHLAEIRFLAGVALAAVVFDFVYWSFGFLRMGTTGTTAQALGRGDRNAVYLCLYRPVVLALVISAFLLVLQLPLRELGFALLSGAPEVEAAGRDYFNARIWGAPATLCNFVFVGWFLGREESRHALIATIAANLANIVFNYIFIIRMQLAATGAGLATMVSQYIMLAVCLALFGSRGDRVGWSWSAVLDRSGLAQLFRLNWEILIRTLCLITGFALFTNFSSILGTAILAANSILFRLLTLAAYAIDGAAFASESLAGIFRGARDLESLRRLIRLALVTGLVFAGFTLAGFFAAPRLILGVLTSHGDLVSLAFVYAPWLVPCLLLGSLAYMYDGLFLGLTEARALRNSMMFSMLAVFLPAAMVALWLGHNHLLWASLALFMLARAATLWGAMHALLVRFAGWDAAGPG
jgi:MATE family multidrug resistance protein